MKAPSLTIGVEEEYQIIDPQTRELQSYITQLLEYDHRFLGQVKPELHQSIVEVGTTVCRTPQEVREELVRLRRGVMELAGLKFFSWVLSESAFSQLSAQKSVENEDKQAEISFFENAEEAMTWLVNSSL